MIVKILTPSPLGLSLSEDYTSHPNGIIHEDVTQFSQWNMSENHVTRDTYLFIYLFIYFFRESTSWGERQRESERERERQRENESQADSTLNTEPDLGLDTMTLGSWPKPKSRVVLFFGCCATSEQNLLALHPVFLCQDTSNMPDRSCPPVWVSGWKAKARSITETQDKPQ